MGRYALTAIVAAVSVAPLSNARADAARRRPRAARSVHLRYQAPESSIFYNEVTVDKSYPGTYFCVCGFRHGYFGIQELTSNGDKVVIFSVWDPGNRNNPDSVAENERVEVAYAGEGVRISRFGNEGTGAKSMFPYRWKTGQKYRCMVKCKVEADKTTYDAYFYLNDEKKWKHLAGFRTITGGDNLKGYYSFVEDFYRNRVSAANSRRARYGNGWVLTTTGDWVALTRAAFTADSTPTDNIDAGLAGEDFFLATGGDTENRTPLRSVLRRLPPGLDLPE